MTTQTSEAPGRRAPGKAHTPSPTQVFSLTIGGRSHQSEILAQAFNPATEELIASYPVATSDLLELAVSAAKRASPSWRAVPFEERQRAVAALGQLVIEHRETLVNLLITEQGKPRAAAEWEIDGAAHWFKGTSELELPHEEFDMGAGQWASARHVPIGVVAAIVPWNFPILLAVWKIAPALLAGNTVVLKPSPHTPLTTLHLGVLAQSVLPPGVLNVIALADELVPTLTEHPDVGMIAFTGSTETGKKVMRAAAGGIKRVSLELGGNDPAIVLQDVDIEAAVPALFWAAFQNSAQFCVATKRLYVHESVYEPFCDALVRYAHSVKVGNGMEPDTGLGPLQNRMQFQKVCDLIEDSRRLGHSFLLGGEVPKQAGYFVPVTIVDNPPDDSRCVVEEAFGPVLPVLKYSTVDEVIQRANASPYGLAASVWGRDAEAALAVGRRIESGVVWINQIHVLGPNVPMSGMKQSGFGVENGVLGLSHYCNLQTIVHKRGG